jgi:glycosyltransferase involved in cell wall biosynthesis
VLSRNGVIRLKKFLLLLAHCLITPPVALVLALGALSMRQDTLKRQREGMKPRLVYGPIPVISIKYICQAMRKLGYEAKTFVYQIYPAHTRADYDYYLGDFLHARWLKSRPTATLLAMIQPYMVFLWLLRHFDVYHFFFSGGFLLGTPLQFLEVQLLHLAGKKVVVMPYGGDVAVPTRIRSLLFRQGLMMNYQDLALREKKTVTWIEYFSNYADFIVGCIFHIETLPRWDILTTHYYPIDTENWRPSGHYSLSNGKDDPVTVVHAPNHRGLKGTEFLITACQELKAEGYQVYLRLLERVPNSEVRHVINESDILAEQFIHGYALTAMEGMSLGKVVMSNLSDDHYYQVHRLYTGLDECPIVDTAIDKIKDNLRLLITHPELRKQLGEAGREYVLKYHSHGATGTMWDTIYRKVWHEEDIDLYVWRPGRPSAISGS